MKKQTYKLIKQSIDLAKIITVISVLTILLYYLFDTKKQNAIEPAEIVEIENIIDYHYSQGREIIVFE